MSRLRIIGVGSPFGMDRIGLLAAERLLEDLADADAVLILDAVHGGRVGHIRCLDPDALQKHARPASTHGFGVAEALALAAALGRLPGHVCLIALETGHDPLAEPPSWCVSELAERALRVVQECIAPLLKRQDSTPTTSA